MLEFIPVPFSPLAMPDIVVLPAPDIAMPKRVPELLNSIPLPSRPVATPTKVTSPLLFSIIILAGFELAPVNEIPSETPPPQKDTLASFEESPIFVKGNPQTEVKNIPEPLYPSSESLNPKEP
ncbi:hypothetical protein J6212_004131 [Salmonella enterica]|nr:hypothetical protein [Salmonella enterica]EHG9845460.1 hypothetical protein [Salmonella enterica]